MSEQQIRQRAVAEVVRSAAIAVGGKEINQAEVMLGLVEFAGRVIAQVAEGPIQAEQLKDACKQHLDRTVRIGLQENKSVIIPG